MVTQVDFAIGNIRGFHWRYFDLNYFGCVSKLTRKKSLVALIFLSDAPGEPNVVLTEIENFLPHMARPSISVPPAMAAGLTDELLSMEDIIRLTDAYEIKIAERKKSDS